MMRVVIIDASISGHHETYMANIAEGLVSLGHEVVLAMAIEHQGSLAAKRLAEISLSVSVLFVPLGSDANCFGGVKEDILREYAYWNFSKLAYSAASAMGHVDRVIIPYVDHCLHAMALMGLPFGETPVTAIAMRPIFHHRSEGVDSPVNTHIQRIKLLLFEIFLAKPTIQKLLTIDPTLYHFARKRSAIKKYWTKVTYFPDPVTPPSLGNKHASREVLGLPEQADIILLYGALDTRKGVKLLLRALASLSAVGRLSVVLAGVMSPEVRRFMDTKECRLLIEQGRLLIFDRYVSEHEERDLLLACDAVWLGYVGHFAMSGVLVKAAQYGRPVIATSRGLLGWFARNLPEAQVIDTNKFEQVCAALLGVSNVRGEVPASLMEHNWHYALEQLI